MNADIMCVHPQPFSVLCVPTAPLLRPLRVVLWRRLAVPPMRPAW